MCPGTLLCRFFLLLNFAEALNFTRNNSNFVSCVETLLQNHFSTNNFNALIGMKFNFITPINKISVDIDTIYHLNLPYGQANGFIIKYNNLEEFNETIKQITHTKSFKSRAKYAIFAKNKSQVTEILEILWHFRLYKSVVVIKRDFGLNIYSINYEKSNCGLEIKPKLLNKCRQGKFAKNINLFDPNLQKSFRHCQLNVAWGNFPPWVFHVNHSDPGIFVHVMNLFGEVGQFKIYYTPENPTYVAELAAEYTFNALLADFNRGQAEIFVGSLNNLPQAIFDTTNSLYDDNLYFIAPKPKRIPYFRTVLHMFSIYGWIGGGTLFVVCCCVFTFLVKNTADQRRFGSFHGNFLNFFAVLLSLGVSHLPESFRPRVFLGLLLLVSIYISAFVQAKFYDIISNPLYYESITSVVKLLESGIPIKFNDGLSIIFLFGFSPESKQIFDTYQPTEENQSFTENIDEVLKVQNYATIIDKGALIVRPNLKKSMDVFEITLFQSCFFMKKYHELFEYFNYMMQRIVESGFVEKFVSDTKFTFSLQYISEAEDKVFKISMKHMEGVFFLIIIGYLVALAAFFMEHVLTFVKRKINKT